MNTSDERAIYVHGDSASRRTTTETVPADSTRRPQRQKLKKYVSHLKVASVQRFRRKHDIVNLLIAVPRPFRVMVQAEARRRGVSMATFIKQAIVTAMHAPCTTPAQAHSVEDLLPQEHTYANT